MSKVSERKRKVRHQVTLKDGTILYVRCLDKPDILALGRIPQVLFTDEGRAIIKGNDEKAKWKLIEENSGYYKRLIDVALTRCVIGVHGDNGLEPFKIVDKPAVECAEEEVSMQDDLTVDDKSAILAAVMKASGVSQEAAAAATPFRAEHGVSSDAGQGVPAVQAAAK